MVSETLEQRAKDIIDGKLAAAGRTIDNVKSERLDKELTVLVAVVHRAVGLDKTLTPYDSSVRRGGGVTDLWQKIKTLLVQGTYKFSDHALDEMLEDSILVDDILEGSIDAIVVEEYPEYGKGPCVLVLQQDQQGHPVHALWGIPKDEDSPAVLITTYRPDPSRWTAGFMGRVSK